MLEKVTLGMVPSDVVRGVQPSAGLINDLETGIQDAIARVYGGRTRWFYGSAPPGGMRYDFELGLVCISYELSHLFNGDAKVRVTVEGRQGLYPQPTGTFLRALLERHELLEKDGDVDAEFTREDTKETGQKALERLHVRATAAFKYQDGEYKKIELSGSTAPGRS